MLFEMAPEIEKKAKDMIDAGNIDLAKQILTNHTHDFASMTMKRWQELKADLWNIFARSM
jgi:hypothetical protein